MVYSYVYCCDIFECSSHFSHPLMHLPTPAPAHRIWYSGDLVSAWWASKPSIVKWRLICSQHLHFEGINLQMTYKYFTDLDTVAQALRLVTLQMLHSYNEAQREQGRTTHSREHGVEAQCNKEKVTAFHRDMAAPERQSLQNQPWHQAQRRYVSGTLSENCIPLTGGNVSLKQQVC